MSISAWFRSLRAAFVLMTTLPVVYPEPVSEQEKRRSVYCYPLVGLTIGGLLWATASLLGSGSLLSASLLLLVWIALTGGIHLDGLADCADAWMAGLGDREKTLKVLKDPLCGAVSVVTLIAVLLVKVSALELLLQQKALAAVIAIPMLARLSPQIMFWHLPYIREGGLGQSLKTHESDRPFFWGVAGFVLVLSFSLLGMQTLWLLLISTVVIACVVKATLHRLDGFTGDVLGAQIELLECALCVIAVLTL
ncbi:MAG: adenosylcobinamide-GDP ribazoletransferase [Acidiferrobacterales bacterium]|nr:adenosylcobinamide-GDP ribazoletransferase [Acidiferrobacterales bacterium]